MDNTRQEDHSLKTIGWTKNLNVIPSFTHELLKEHLITNTSIKINNGRPNNAHEHKKEGYQLFKNKMVIHVLVKANIMKGKEKFILVKCNVHASMKKTQYVVYVHLHQDTGKVSHASCSCPAGQGGCCKHVAALLFQLLDYIQLELTEVPDDLTCTSNGMYHQMINLKQHYFLSRQNLRKQLAKRKKYINHNTKIRHLHLVKKLLNSI